MWHSIYLANMGVNAFTYSMLRYMEEIASQLGVCFDYTVLGHNPKGKDDCIEGITIEGRVIPVKCERAFLPGTNVRQLSDWVSLLRWLVLEARSFLDKLAEYDLVLDVSEGDSFTDIYGSGRFTQMTLSKILTLVAGKTLVLLPQTIGPFSHTVARLIANQVMRRVRYVYPRDQVSLHYLEKTIAKRSFREYLDVAFYLPYERSEFTQDKVHVGLNVSGLLWQGGYTRDNQFHLRSNYQQLARDIIQYFLDKEDIVVHLVPHVVSQHYRSQEDDYVVAEQIHRDVPETVLAPAFGNPMEAKSYISGLDFFAGARMHSCIAAYSSGVPVVPMAYSRKFSGLFTRSLGYPALVDLRSDGQKEAYQKVCEGFNDRATLRQAILAKRDTIEKSIDAFRQELTAIVEEIYEA